jgi:hypothetical protein
MTVDSLEEHIWPVTVMDDRVQSGFAIDVRSLLHFLTRTGVGQFSVSAIACFQQLLQFARHPFQSCGQVFVEVCPPVIRESAVRKHIASRSIRSFGQKRTNPPPGKGILTRTS